MEIIRLAECGDERVVDGGVLGAVEVRETVEYLDGAVHVASFPVGGDDVSEEGGGERKREVLHLLDNFPHCLPVFSGVG